MVLLSCCEFNVYRSTFFVGNYGSDYLLVWGAHVMMESNVWFDQLLKSSLLSLGKALWSYTSFVIVSVDCSAGGR